MRLLVPITSKEDVVEFCSITDNIEFYTAIGYGKVSSFKSLFDSYSPTAYSRNIYYSYK